VKTIADRHRYFS